METNQYTLNDDAQALFELAALHEKVLHKWGDIASGSSGNNTLDSILSIRRPWLEPGEGALPFDAQETVALGIVGTQVTILTITVPDGYDGALNAYSWNFAAGGFVDGSGDLVVRMLRNGTPVRNFSNITVQKGTVNQPRSISPIRLYSKDVFSLVISHVANAALAGNIVGCFQGYFYPARG